MTEPEFDPDRDTLPAEADACAGLLNFGRSAGLTGGGWLGDYDDLAHIEELMAKHIPSSTYIMRAVPAGNGKFHALYAAPGLVPDIAKTADGRPYEYDTEVEAEHGAARFRDGLLNTVRRKAREYGRQETFQKLTGEELAVLMARAGITPTLLAYVKGTRPERVMRWLHNEDNVPHDVRVLLELFIGFGEPAIDLAERVTESVATERRPPRKEAS